MLFCLCLLCWPFFIDANFEVLLIVSDAVPVVLFFLAMFYLYGDQFYALENSPFKEQSA